MREHPILFSEPMVRAILEGRKTQTRRVAIKTSQPRNVYISDFDADEYKIEIENKHSGQRHWKQCKYGIPGDRLWVRETWAFHPDFPESTHRAIYRADPGVETDVPRWRPSIHMPRWASRINLEITGIRIERLADISEADAIAEGIERDDLVPFNGPWFAKTGDAQGYESPTDAYCALWESINEAGSWFANPWVWVIEFKRVTP